MHGEKLQMDRNKKSMTPNEFLEIIKQAGKLKTTMRHCWMTLDSSDDDPAESDRADQTDARGPYRRESVAEHSWRLALMAMLLSGEEEFAALDMNKVIRMCLIHDLGESFTGDIPAFLKSRDDTGTEIDIYREWVKRFPERQKQEWLDLLSEMEALETKEAKTYKALDKLEALIAHNESDLATWLPLEYDLQYTYGQENMAFSPFFTELRKAVDEWTADKIGDKQ